MKKTIFLILVGLLAAMPAAMRAATATVDVDQLRYTVDTDAGTAEVYGPASSSATITDLVIPDFIEYESAQYPVTSIRDYEFMSKTNLRGSLTLGDKVTTIGAYAFPSCSGFTGSLIIPESVTSIGSGAFSLCEKISSLEILSQNLEIYYQAFQMNGLESVTCLATTPPPCIYEGTYDYVFSSLNYDKPLYVPAQSVDSYKTATEWKKFTNINPLPVSATSISLNKSETALLVGATETLIATLEPEGATDEIVWSVTADPSGCVTVENGKITAHAVGTATVTATAGEYSASCAVTVNPVTASGITLNVADMTLLVGATDKLTATVEPENVTDKTVTWSSDNEAVATVAADGTVTAVSVGVANITATCGEATATCKVTVNPVTASGITLNVADMTLLVGATDKLTATVEPENVTDKTVTWSSDNEAVATVDNNGNVTAVSVGIANITATCGEATATCKVTVNPVPASGITLNVADMTLLVGATDKLTATVEPENVTDKTVIWSSDNEAVATVAADGTVTAISVGIANITASCGEATATCKVTVNPVTASGITLNVADMTLLVGATDKLTATVEPENVTDKTITWSSDNEAVATVAADGTVTAVSVGVANITATCAEATATCKVTVNPIPASEIILNMEDMTLTEGESAQLTATVKPDDTTYPDIIWSSGNEAVATVDADGTVTAVAEGTAVITARCGDVTATCTVTVVALPAPVARPETPAKIMRKGNGTSCTFITIMDMTDSQLAGEGYSFVYGYTDASGADNVIAHTAARYCHTTEAVFNNAANDFWVFAVCTDGEGVTAGSERRHLDGSVDDDYDLTAILEAGRGTDGTDSANWIRPTSRGARITIESVDDATVTVYTVGGRLMMTQHVGAGTALSEEISSDVLAPTTYIIRVASGSEAVTKKVIIR